MAFQFLLRVVVTVAFMSCAAGGSEATESEIKLFIFADSSRASKACEIALIHAAGEAGIRVLTSSEQSNSTKYTRVDIANGLLPGSYLPAAFKAASVFDGPDQFSRFLSSQLYRDVLRDERSLVGIAYGGFKHLFSSDTPVLEPTDLAGRGVALVDVSNAPEFFEYEITFFNPKAYLALVAHAESVPPEFKGYLALTMTQLNVAAFYSDLDGAEQRLLQPVIDLAVRDCSSKLLKQEMEDLAGLQSTGTKVVSADRPAFRAATRAIIERRATDPKRTKKMRDEARRVLDLLNQIDRL